MTFGPAIKTPDALPVLVGTPGAGAFVLVRSQGKTYRVPVGNLPGAAAADAASADAASAVLELNGKEPSIPPGAADQFWRGDKTWQNLFGQVRATALTGLSMATNAAVSATDTVLAALGKLQAQISAHSGSGGTAHSAATTASAGFMSAADKVRLDGSVHSTIALAADTDMNTVTTSGFYRLNGGTPTNVPGGSSVEWGQLIVSRGADTIFQILTGWTDSRFYMRHGALGVIPVWQPWQEVLTTGVSSNLRQQRATVFAIFAASNNMTLVAGCTYTVYLHDGPKTLYLPTPANTRLGDEIEFVNLHMGWGKGGSGNAFVIAMNGNTSVNFISDSLNVDVRCGGFRLKCHWLDTATSSAFWSLMI